MHKKRSHLTYLTFIKYLSIIFYDKVAGKIFDVNCAIINARMGGADCSGSPTPHQALEPALFLSTGFVNLHKI